MLSNKLLIKLKTKSLFSKQIKKTKRNTGVKNLNSLLNYTVPLGSSETTRVACLNNFSYWLAGLIDGDGSLLVSRKGYTSCEITVHSSEVFTLFKVKKLLGGKIKKREKANAFRWRLHNTAGMKQLVNLINGKILLPKTQKTTLKCL